MKLPALAGFVLLTPCFLATLCVAPYAALAAPAGFELDLKELKKPSSTLIAPKKQTPAPKKTQPQPTAKAPAKKSPPTAKTTHQAKQPPKTQPATQVTTTPNEPVEQVVLLDGATPCQLARLLLEAVAKPVPVAEALQGIATPATAAGRHQGATAVLACGMPPAESYTLGRLLEAEGIQLISLTETEQPAQVVQAVAQGLGLSYRQRQDVPLSYLTNDYQGQPIRLVVGSSGAAP